MENSERDGNTRPEYQIYLLRNLYVGQKVTVITEHRITDGFQIGRGVHQDCILSPCLFDLYAEYIMRNTRMDKAQAGSRMPGKVSITSDMQMTPHLRQKAKH